MIKSTKSCKLSKLARFQFLINNLEYYLSLFLYLQYKITNRDITMTIKMVLP